MSITWPSRQIAENRCFNINGCFQGNSRFLLSKVKIRPDGNPRHPAIYVGYSAEMSGNDRVVADVPASQASLHPGYAGCMLFVRAIGINRA